MDSSKIKLGYRERDKLFNKEFTELKIKVILNWFEIIALLAVTFFISLKIITSIIKWDSVTLPVIASVAISIGITYLFCCFRSYQLKITRFDKEHIYKKISKDLIDESKSDNESINSEKF